MTKPCSPSPSTPPPNSASRPPPRGSARHHALAARAVGSTLEDLEDYDRAASAWAELDPSQVKSLDEMKRELGLAD